MAAKYPSDVLSTPNDIQLCPLDQKQSGSCLPNKCDNLHMCRDYLLNKKCSEFESNGKCSRSHSLFTLHNQRILKKLNLSAKDGEIFDKISGMIEASKSNSSEKISVQFRQSTILDDDRDIKSISRQTSVISAERGHSRLSLQPTSASSFARKTPSDNPSSTNKISTHLSLLTNSGFSQNNQSKSMDLSSSSKRHLTNSLSIDLSGNQFDRQAQSLSISKDEKQNDHPSSSDDTGENNDTSITSRTGKSLKSSISGFFRTKMEKYSAKTDPDDSPRSDKQLKYIFHKYSKDNQLSYLFGPVRRYLMEDKRYQIFPSGYCRLANTDQEKEIEQKLRIALPMTLITARIYLINDDLAFLISTSAAERIFEQNQISYSIISEHYTTTLSIEVIQTGKDNRTRSRSASLRKDLSTRLSIKQERPHTPLSDSKFLIPNTNSSIDVIYGDITQTKVDLMVCVTTSITLLNSVLDRAGRSIELEFKQRYYPAHSLILDGGLTSARKILFINWELAVESSNIMKAQQSLSNLVKQCIDEAYQLKMTSISFPSIGTGRIGLDPNKVCELMINTASECLHKYKIDVLFIIYRSSGNDHNQQSYQVFRNYLDQLRTEKSSVSHIPQSLVIPVERSQHISQNVECKRISTVSTSPSMTHEHQLLVKLLERLIEKKTFDLSLVQQGLIDRIELLIDKCMDYHVIPRIDFGKGELILRGDCDSCSQCFANLRNQRLISKYSLYSKTGRKHGEIKMNMYVSMKIDEAFTNGESNIKIEDDDRTVFDIDLNASEVHVNGDRDAFSLFRMQLNADSKILPPRLWSSLFMIQTVKVSHSSLYSMEWAYTFEQTMPKTEWQILRIDAIENWPLYVHYSEKKHKDEILAFHGCSFSSVQSIIHYGLHSNNNRQPANSIRLTRDALSSHIQSTRRSTDGKYYMFVVQLAKKVFNNDSGSLTNEDAHLALPTYLITYQRKIIL